MNHQWLKFFYTKGATVPVPVVYTACPTQPQKTQPKLRLSWFIYSAAYPSGLLLCQRQESAHISRIPSSAFQPSSTAALAGSA